MELFISNMEGDFYSRAIFGLEQYGDVVTVRQQRTHELRGVTVRTQMGWFPLRKGMSLKFIAAESMGYVAGTIDYGLLQKAAPHVDSSLLTPIMAYGPRMQRSLKRAVAELAENPTSRRAVIHVTHNGDQPTEVPCTLVMTPLVRDGFLHLDVAMRSWDLVMGLTYDIPGFSVIGQCLAFALQLLPGELTVHAASFHVYDATRHLAVDRGVNHVTLNFPETSHEWRHLQKPAERWKRIVREASACLERAHDGDWWTFVRVNGEAA